MIEDALVRLALEDERYTPNDMARDTQALLDRLIPERDSETDKSKRKELSRRIKSARILRQFARTRAGYVQPR
jgi:hypothetical protein